MKYFWFSFTDSKGLLGVVISKGNTLESALNAMELMNINPGGNISHTEIKPHGIEENDILRLLNGADLYRILLKFEEKGGLNALVVG